MKESNEEKDYIFGLRPIIEAIEAGKTVDKILIQKELKSEQLSLIRRMAKQKQIPISLVPIQKLQRVTRSNHQGVIAFISPVNFHSIENLLPRLIYEGVEPVLLVLDGITDVRNFGSILRTAECMGVHAVIIPARNSVSVNADTVKTSAGSVFNIPICKEMHFGNILEFLKESGIKLVGCTEKAKIASYDADLKAPLAIVMGNEEIGIHEKTIEKLDTKVLLPMSGNTASLNVAVATGMVLYEVNRQNLNQRDYG